MVDRIKDDTNATLDDNPTAELSVSSTSSSKRTHWDARDSQGMSMKPGSHTSAEGTDCFSSPITLRKYWRVCLISVSS